MRDTPSEKVLVLYKKLKGFPSGTYGLGYLLSKKNGFSINIGHKIEAKIEIFDESDDGVLLPLLLF